MNSASLIKQCRILEGTPLKLMSRVTDATLTKILTASIASLSYSVYTITSGVSQPVLKAGPTALDVAASWFDTYQVDAGWQEDTTGYNVGFTLPASLFTGVDRRGQKYQVEVRATRVSGDAFWVGIWDVDVVDALSITS